MRFMEIDPVARLAALVLAALPLAARPAQDSTEDDAARERTKVAEVSELATLVEIGRADEAAERGLPLLEPGALLAGDGRGIAFVARALLAADRVDDARALLERAQPTPETGVWIELERARLELETDELEDAANRLMRPDGSPRLPAVDEAWYLCGQVLVRLGQLPDAAPYLSAFVQRQPFSPDTVAAYHLLHLAAVLRSDDEQAVALRRESERRRALFDVIRRRTARVHDEPDDPALRHSLGLAYTELGDFRGAAATYRELAQRRPRYDDVWYLLGEAERRSGDRVGAMRAFDEALVRDPENWKALLQRAFVRIDVGETDRARDELNALLASPVGDDPRYVEIYLGLARCARAEGEQDVARETYELYQSKGGKLPLVPPSQGG